ncbi:MAG: beta-ketoacyl synthase N-terminal-like domain-containing protein [Vicinamibacterales bacterium]
MSLASTDGGPDCAPHGLEVPVRAWGVCAPRRPDGSASPIDNEELGRMTELSLRDRRKLDRFTMLGLCAARVALAELGATERADCGIANGTMLAGWCFAEPQLALLHGPGLTAMSPYLATAWFPAAPQGEISIRLGLQGWAKTVATDRCAGAHAIALAAQRIMSGRQRRALAGGTDAPLSTMVRRALAGAGWQVDTLAEAAAYLLLDATAASPLAVIGYDTGPAGDHEPFLAHLRRRRKSLRPGAAIGPAVVAADQTDRDTVPAVCDVLGVKPDDVVDVVATSGDSLGASSAVAAALACEALTRCDGGRPERIAVAVARGHQGAAALWFRHRLSTD